MKNQHRLPAHVRPERYKIMLRPDLQNFTFYGEETIYLILEKSTREIILHSTELEIECEQAQVTYDEKKETVKLSFAQPIPEGKHQLKLKFKGFLNDKMMYFHLGGGLDRPPRDFGNFLLKVINLLHLYQ